MSQNWRDEVRPKWAQVECKCDADGKPCGHSWLFSVDTGSRVCEHCGLEITELDRIRMIRMAHERDRAAANMNRSLEALGYAPRGAK